jgi:hypothetical protein
MVYVLVAVLIAAICVLAILLFSGGSGPGARRTGGLEAPAVAAPTTEARR